MNDTPHLDQLRTALADLERAARNVTTALAAPVPPHPPVSRHGARQVVDMQMCAALSLWLQLYYKEFGHD
jgi:hypothetical protein